MLAGLEADLSASKRDVGWLQENLTTVQNATGLVEDKVAKMQSAVANMERQIGGVVKVNISCCCYWTYIPTRILCS